MPDFDTHIPRRGTGSLKWDRRPDLEAFWVADMDFASPPEVVAALAERVRHGIFGYALPHVGLEEALCEYLADRHGAQASAEEMIHLGGLVPALSLAGRAFAKAGDAFLTCTPVYPPFLGVHRDHGLELITVPHVHRDERWKFDWDALEAAVTPKTRLFLLCNPQNPLGRVFSEEEVLNVAEFCARHDLILIADEIHCDLVLEEDRTPFFSCLNLPPELAARTVVLLAPSKTYNIAGLGYSFAVIRDRNLRRRFAKAKGHMLPEINCLAYYAAEAAYRHGDSWRQDLLAHLRCNRDLIATFCREDLPGLVVPDMEATYLAWLDFRPLDIENPAALLEEKAGLFLSDGSFFGAPGHARLNFGCPRPQLRNALERIRDALR